MRQISENELGVSVRLNDSITLVIVRRTVLSLPAVVSNDSSEDESQFALLTFQS